MITPPEWLVGAAEPWATLYSDSGVIRTVVVSLHLVPLVLGGGVAVATDRDTLALRPATDEVGRARMLSGLGAVHRWVGPALAVTIVSGVLLLLADLEQFLGSRIYWVKMLLVGALLVNGLAMMRAERGLAAQATGAAWDERAADAWRKIRRTSILSLALWTTIVVVGVALVNAS